MTLGLCFWVLMIVWVVFSFAVRGGYVGEYSAFGSTLLLVVLFGLLGWQVFGAPLHK